MIESGKRPLVTLFAFIHVGHLYQHCRAQHASGTIQTMLKNEFGGCQALSQKQLDRTLGKNCPQAVLFDPPLFLKERCKGIVVKPKRLKLRVVQCVVFRTPNPLKILIVKPIDVCMSILSVT
jgi:hypothetical protein